MDRDRASELIPEAGINLVTGKGLNQHGIQSNQPWDSPTPAGGHPKAKNNCGMLVGGGATPKLGTNLHNNGMVELAESEDPWYLSE